MSTEEELNQVLVVLQELARNGWVLPGEGLADPEAQPDTVLDDSPEAGSLAEIEMVRRPELKN
jgi:hypothetical protein